MKIRNLNTGDTFRFPLGLATYIILSCNCSDEMGWLVNFANIKTGQKYQYQEPWDGRGKNPTERKVIRTKKQAIRQQYCTYGPDWRSCTYLNKSDVEKFYNIKLSKKTIVK